MSDASELLRVLRRAAKRWEDWSDFRGTMSPRLTEAASLIEAQAARIERLEEALGWFLTDPTFNVSVGGNPVVVRSMLAAAREALTPSQTQAP